MAIVTLNPLITSARGKTGNIVFYRRYDKICMRTRVKGRNPKTETQQAVRMAFGDAVKAWQNMPEEERYKYTRKARRLNMSGYNLFISAYVNTKIVLLCESGLKIKVSRNTPGANKRQADKTIQNDIDHILFSSVSPPFHSRK